MITKKNYQVGLTPKDNALIQLISNYDRDMLINRRDSLIQTIANCNDTNESELFVQEHDDVLLALVQMN